jgi:quercetin dioxygenase-like cupin family protein/SAM-dependent methyltransferase
MFLTYIGREMSSYGRKLESCRMCDSQDLYEFLDLGFTPGADGILSDGELSEPEIYFPLKVCQCGDCGLTQLTYVASPELLYDEKYSYESSITETGKKHYLEMAESISKRFGLKDELVVDIGSNVGVLLEGFSRNGCRVLGFDIAPKIVEIANKMGVETWKSFMNVENAHKVVNEKGQAKVVCATNVFSHIDDKKGLMEGLNVLLGDDGVFVIEAPYFVDLVESLEYDTIYLDHLEYLTLKPLIRFFDKYGFQVFDVEKHEIHGSSLRIFVGRKGKWTVERSVDKLLELEDEKGIYDREVLDKFSKDVRNHKEEFLDMLYNLKKQGKKIVGISAPAKGNTLLNYCKLNDNIIDWMTEKSEIKVGRYTPGMHIPIVAEERLLEEGADYGIIFAWNFADEIAGNEINTEFVKGGGKLIKPIPKPIVMGIQEQNLFGVEIKKIDPVFMDERGIITDLLNEKISHVGMITTEKDAVRANHFHKLSSQYSYILSGSFEVLLALVEKPDNVKRVEVSAGELISIPPNVIHKFKAIERAVMIDMISESREGEGYEDDVYRVEIEYNE